MTSLRFEVPGKPVAWAKSKFQPADKRQWTNLCRMAMVDAARAAGFDRTIPFTGGPVELVIVAIWPMPKNRHLKRGFREREWRVQTPDYDNMCKIVGDAGNGVLWSDDKVIVVGKAATVTGAQDEAPRTVIIARALEHAPDEDGLVREALGTH